jgi:hypothetical protein
MVIEITYALKKLREHRGGGSTTFFNLLISKSLAPPLDKKPFGTSDSSNSLNF